MDLTAKQQVADLIKNANNVALFTHISPDGDALGSIIALQLVLEKLGKKVSSFCADPVPASFSFLPNRDKIEMTFRGIKESVISLNASKVKGDYQLGYKVDEENQRLNIFISPAYGIFRESDIEFRSGGFQHDLIITLDTPIISRLGSLYENNKNFFEEIPIINIDHHSGNENFGKVNWVDSSATSACEILVSMIESLGRDRPLFDSEIATALLTGIITDTGSFQNSNTTPKSLTIAAQLVAIGAKREEIINAVFRTHSLSTLKLWGRILTNVSIESREKFAWAAATKDDFFVAGAKEEEASGVVDHFLKSIPEINFVILISEKEKEGNKKIVHGSLRSVKKDVNVAKLAELFGGGGHNSAAGFDIESDYFEKTKNEIIEKLKRSQVINY